MLHTRIMLAGEIVDHLVCAKGVPRENDMCIAFLLGKVQIGLDVFIGIRKSFVPGADQFLFASVDIDRSDLPKGVVGLGIDKINATVI